MKYDNKILNSIKVIVLASILTLGLQYVSAQTWQAPGGTPPGSNTYAPLNVGTSGQIKEGGLTLNAGLSPGPYGLNVAAGKVSIGSGINTTAKLDVNGTAKFVQSVTVAGATDPTFMQISGATGQRSALFLYKPNGGSDFKGWSFRNDNDGNLALNYDNTAYTANGTAAFAIKIPVGSATPAVGIGRAPANIDDTVALDVNGKVKIAGGSPGPGKVLTSDTNGVATWQTAPSSDESLKTNIKSLGANMLNKVLQLKGVSFNWKDTGDTQSTIGFLAQDVEKVFPEVVHVEDNGTKSVDYQKLVAPVVEAIKAQQAEIDDLKTQIKALQATKSVQAK